MRPSAVSLKSAAELIYESILALQETLAGTVGRIATLQGEHPDYSSSPERATGPRAGPPATSPRRRHSGAMFFFCSSATASGVLASCASPTPRHRKHVE